MVLKMTAKITFFPVDNGDMTLIRLESKRTILIDMNIRNSADDPDDDTLDVATKLREQLPRDNMGRLYVDALLLSHPDQDHCRGLQKHFHLGTPEDWSKDEDNILIREMWSSPMVFRRASKNHQLCEDAKAFNKEARRRVALFRVDGPTVSNGDRILILGEDEDGKTDDLSEILIKVNETFSRIGGIKDDSVVARLLAPMPKDEDEGVEETLSKNKSSTIMQFSLSSDGEADVCQFLTGGDAEVSIWEKLWEQHAATPSNLGYDVLQTPHHCSWRSLSYDSWSELGEKAKVCTGAKNALSQGRQGALIVASSKPIKDNDDDPPCIRAKREYESMAKDFKGRFKCVGEHPSEKNPDILEIQITRHGPKPNTKLMGGSGAAGTGVIGHQPLPHG